MNTDTTRRALLKGAPAVAVALTIPASASAIAAPADRSAWDAAMAAYTHAKTACDEFDPIYERIWEAYEAGRPGMDKIHWKEFPFADRDHVARAIDLEKRWRDFLAGEGKWWWASNPEKRKAEFRAALDSVKAFRDAEASHDRDSGFEAADEKWNALVEGMVERAWRLMEMAAPDLGALRWKLDYISEDGSFASFEKKSLAPLMADIARLLPEGA